MNIDVLISRIDATDQEIEVLSNIDNPLSEHGVTALEQKLSCLLPTQYRNFLMYCGGMAVEVIEEVWPRTSTLLARPFWTFQYGFLIFGAGEQIPEYLDSFHVTQQLRQDSSLELVPFLRQIASPDLYCFDNLGNVCFWSHDEPNQVQLLDEDFVTTVVRQIDQLEASKTRVREYLAS